MAKGSITLKLSPAAKDILIDQGFDPVYGARPLKRAIQHHIENLLELEILKGKVLEGTRLIGQVNGDQMVFRAYPVN